ncbi:MAG: MmcQ/YjbR family DNA-binding protein [Oscillospiraceae bacterium]|nr:MmcQ/YjbR family DNA-binding protein [Oscillospiraceae bacterium]
MNQKQVEEYCSTKKGAEIDYQEEWEAIRGRIHEKMFVLIGADNNGKKFVSLKCEPMLAEVYRKQYKNVVPGYYLNKTHWNSIYVEEGLVPGDVLKEMIDMSYDLVLKSLPKKVQAEYI